MKVIKKRINSLLKKSIDTSFWIDERLVQKHFNFINNHNLFS